jgi:hypothetical protein
MKNVMAAASEAEVGALFHNGQEAAHIQNILKEIGREQLNPTRMTTDNSTADGFANKRTKIRRSKAMNMRFYWIQNEAIPHSLVTTRAQPCWLLHQAPRTLPPSEDETHTPAHRRLSTQPHTGQ